MFPYLVQCLASFLILAAFRAEAQTANPASKDVFFDPNRVLSVHITLPPADWDALRNQERDAKAEFSKDRLDHPMPSPYTWFSAEVTINGTRFKNVGVRKRGFFGSADKTRPALNVELDRSVKGQQFEGRGKLKLHNNKQDGTSQRQVLAYQLFAAAGVPAPRCNLAQVIVNGANLGIYSNLEPIDDAFLTRHFGGGKGNLYEAQISDFRPGWTRTFEKKNNKEATRQDLEGVATALQSDDSQWLDRLDRVLDVDAFISFWAMEGLINHWDGFAGDLNNCFIYHDPKSGKLRFIAWGADATFGPHHVFVPFEPPASVWAVSYLTRRLYNHPSTRQKYRARLQELLGSVWNEKQLMAEVERIGKLTAGLSTVPPFQSGPEMAQLKQFIGSRRSVLEKELRSPAQPWTYPMHKELYSTPIGKVSAEFSTAWVPSVFAPAPAGARARVKFDFHGRQYAADFTDVKAMPDILNPGNAAIALTGAFPGVEVPVAVWISTPTIQFHPGKILTAGSSNSVLIVVAGQIGKPDFRILGTWESGPVKLEHAGRAAEAKVTGSIDAVIASVPWEDFDLANLRKAP